MSDEVMHADCEVLLPTLGDRSIDHAITDPPYLAHVHECGRRGCTGYEEGSSKRAQFNRNRSLGFEPLGDELRALVASELVRICRRWLLVFCDHEGGEAWRQAIVGAGGEFVRFGIWHKLNATPQFTGDRPGAGHEVIVIAHAPRKSGRMRWNGGGRHAFWSCSTVIDHGGKGARLHTTQKPLGLMEALVRDFTDPGETILDPFAGSGTTLVAAKKLGRRYVGVEIDAKYVNIARQRLDDTREQMEMW